MPQDLFQYPKLVEAALRGVVREVLSRTSRQGMRGGHHFYIGFATRAPGVVLPPQLLERYPDEMTIVLQHQFWDLQVAEDAFSVTLSFQSQPERLSIPFAAIRTFTDPSVSFGLQFGAGEEPKPAPAALPAPIAAVTEQPKEDSPPAEAAAQTPHAGAEVVALDKFRKR
ncbi:MAG: hypothetical protein JO305_09970 [Alphaproteobacteria bacterium]|nr:hypothetical protein [Alphaproteobacteria bacterium]